MKKKTPAWRKSKDPADRLILAADNWLKKRGGDGIIAGPICIVSEPYKSEREFIIGVKITGRRPAKIEDSANIPLEPDTEYLMKYLADQYGNICMNERTYSDYANYLHGFSDKAGDNGQLEMCWRLLQDAQRLVSTLRRFEKK